MGAELVIFDCDGVLVDSEVLVVAVEARLLTEAGFPITADEIVERFVGLSYGLMMEQLAADFGRAVPDGLRQQVEEAALAELATSVTPVPGMAELVGGLADADRARCVASSSDLDRIQLSLEVAGLAPSFAPEHLFSVQMVDRPKPAPDVFLLAADALGVEPSRCVVVEDSPHGVEGARAAGMAAVGLTAGGHAGPGLSRRLLDAGAQHVFTSTAELGDYLAA
ncbi:MAG: HAD family phosphatase [Actinomycetota bacterium]